MSPRQFKMTHMLESKKTIYMNLLTKQKQTHRHRKTDLRLPKGKGGGGGINQGFGMNRYTLLHIKQITNKDLQSTGNYIQSLVMTYNGKESE